MLTGILAAVGKKMDVFSTAGRIKRSSYGKISVDFTIAAIFLVVIFIQAAYP